MTRLPFSAVLACASALLAAGACRQDSVSLADPAIAERFIGARLPPGAKAIRSDVESGVDTRILLRFDAPAAEAARFAARLLGRDPTPSEDPMLGHFGSGIDWWAPVAGQGSAGGRADDRARNRSYRILVVPKDSGMATVWLVAFSS